MNPSTQEYVNIYTFEVGEGDFAKEMCSRGANESEARAVLDERLSLCGMGGEKMTLQSVKERVAVRTKFRVAS